ncbi:MAG TPA: hypothetical protein VKA70_14735 [Blastocatellia bacterium]|nr:hypothetical protein [Blastocatellia bacterium]
MKTTVGIFEGREQAARAIERLRSLGIPENNIDLLAPGVSEQRREAVATTETEQPGMGKALGGVVGGAIGAASGMSLGAAAASLFIPGVGPIIATGIVGAALFGAGGAIGGAAAGKALEEGMSDGLPKDELFVYEDALRRGRTVVIALTRDDEQDKAARDVMAGEGAESVDAAREQWWVGLRDAEIEDYRAQGGDLTEDEHYYRRGFESALYPDSRGKPYEDAQGYLRECHGDMCEQRPFRRGYDRGQAYYKGLRDEHQG